MMLHGGQFSTELDPDAEKELTGIKVSRKAFSSEKTKQLVEGTARDGKVTMIGRHGGW